MLANTNSRKVEYSLLASLIIPLLLNLPANYGNMQSHAQIDVSGLDELHEDIESILPDELTDAELSAFEQIVLSDQRVREMIGERPFEIMSYDFVGNTNTRPVIWSPDLHINVGNTTQISVVVDVLTDTVTAESKPMNKRLQPATTEESGNGYAVDYITDDETVNGLMMRSVAPTTDYDEFVAVAFLLNAVTVNTREDWHSCSPAYFETDYFAQVGFTFGGDQAGTLIIWADTATGCLPQFIPSSSLEYVEGHEYEFKIFVDSSNRWVMFAKDRDTGDSFTKLRSGVDYLVMKTDSLNTSVFMENINRFSPTWYDDFDNPSARVWYKETSNPSVWFNWDTDERMDIDCDGSGHAYPYSSTQEVINGDLDGGSTATWNNQRMAQNYPACGGLGVYAEDDSGSYLEGMAVSLYDSGNNLLESGYTPYYTTVHTTGDYVLKFSNYGSYAFSGTEPAPPTAPVDDVDVYSWGGDVFLSLSDTQEYEVDGIYSVSSTGSITIRSEREDTGAQIDGLYVQLQNSGHTEIANGFTTKLFSNLNAGTYYVYPNDYAPYYFSHWEDTGSTSRERQVNLGSGQTPTYTAVYDVIP